MLRLRKRSGVKIFTQARTLGVPIKQGMGFVSNSSRTFLEAS